MNSKVDKEEIIEYIKALIPESLRKIQETIIKEQKSTFISNIRFDIMDSIYSDGIEYVGEPIGDDDILILGHMNIYGEQNGYKAHLKCNDASCNGLENVERAMRHLTFFMKRLISSISEGYIDAISNKKKIESESVRKILRHAEKKCRDMEKNLEFEIFMENKESFIKNVKFFCIHPESFRGDGFDAVEVIGLFEIFGEPVASSKFTTYNLTNMLEIIDDLASDMLKIIRADIYYKDGEINIVE